MIDLSTESNNPGDLSQYTVEHVKDWMETLVKTRDWVPKKAADYGTCLKAFTDMRAEGDPEDLKWYVDNIDTLVRRRGQGTGGSGAVTTKNYRRKALNAIEWFQYVQVHGTLPAKAVGQRANSSNGGGEEKPKSKPKVKPRAEDSNGMTVVALGGDASITYRVTGGYTTKDAQRFYCHLLTLASDFDPEKFMGAAFSNE